MKFASAKGFTISGIIVFLIAMVIFTCFKKPFVSAEMGFNFVQLILLPVVAYTIWMWFDTWYIVDKDTLHYHSALLKGAIVIATITRVTKKKPVFGH
jgi:uncharacterized membrane protein YwaF